MGRGEALAEIGHAGVAGAQRPGELGVVHLIVEHDRRLLAHHLSCGWGACLPSCARVGSPSLGSVPNGHRSSAGVAPSGHGGSGLPYSGAIGGAPAPRRAPAGAGHGDVAFVGRRAALEVVGHRLERAREHEAQVVWIEGASGAGKSAFVRHLVAGTRGGDTVLWAQAEELASDQSFALLSQLVPVESATPFAAGMRLVEHLGTLPSDAPAILVIEDVHWADPPSMTALLAVAQRLHHDHVALVLTSRPGARLDGWGRFLLDPERCLRLVLDGLDDDEVGALARQHGVELDAAQARRLREHTGGHPLYVGALLRELTPDQLRARSGALPAPPSLAAVVRGSVAALPADAQALAASLAVLGAVTPLAVAGQVGGVDDPTEALEALLGSGLARWIPGEP
ncbi:MAG: AAA family ATPase, partial [Ilumatobacteraceae bacterium]